MAEEKNNLLNIYKRLKGNEEDIKFRYVDNGEVFEVSDDRYYHDINKLIHRLNELKKDGYSNFGILSENSYEFYTLFMAALLSKTMITMLNIMEKPEIVMEDIKRAGVNYLFVGKEVANSVGSCLSGELNSELLLIPDRTEEEVIDFPYEDLFKPSMIFFTSGTTGSKKAVLLCPNNFFASPYTVFVSELGDVFAGKRRSLLLALPAYHVGGICGFQSVLFNDGTVHISNMRNTFTELKLMPSDYSATVPAVIKLWQTALKRGKPEKLGGIKYIYSGAASMEGVDIDLYKKYGIKIRQTYGMTETGGRGTVNLGDDFMSQGMPGEMSEIKISNEGEVLVKSAGNMVGYLDNEEETKDIYENGWIHTGDLGRLDEEGKLWITGRIKNLIILSGGENVSPEQIEKDLYSNSDISECFVYAKVDRIYADIYCDPEKRDSVKIFVNEYNAKSPIFRRIKAVNFVDEGFEKGHTGKLIRRK